MRKKILSLVMVMAVAFAMLIPEFSLANTTATKDTDSSNTTATATAQSNATTKAVASNNYAAVSANPIAGRSLTFTAKGDGQDLYGTTVADGTTAYVANSVSVYYYKCYDDDEWEYEYDDSKDITIHTTATYKPAYSGIHTATFSFTLYEYTDGYWSETSIVEKTISFNVSGAIKYNANGGKVGIAYKYLPEGAKLGALPKATRKGYKLLGWYNSKSSKTKLTSSSRARFYSESSKTIYAKWTKKVKVKFNGCKGKAGKKYKKTWTNKKYGSLPKAKRSGYIFKGWYTKKHGGKRITKNSYLISNKSVTLYAHWFGPKGHGSTMTKAEFKRIKNGMSRKQVKFLVGSGGSLLSEYAGYRCYMWDGNGSIGSNAEVYFDDEGCVYAKAQAGLR